MGTVIIEREFAERRSLGDLQAMRASSAWCLSLHGVVPLRHYLATDGRRMVCLFRAPDAEALRRTMLTGRMQPPRHLWPAAIHGTEPSGKAWDGTRQRSLVVVERALEQPTPFEAVQALEDAAPTCFEQRDVRAVASYFSLDRRRMLCLYDAPDAEAVRLANRLAGLPFDVAWSSRVVIEEGLDADRPA